MLREPLALEAKSKNASLQPILIATGTPITCELGHVVCVTASDVHANEPLAVEMFTRWRRAAPQAGDAFPRCSVCQGPAHRAGPEGPELHTAEGWLPLKGTAASTVATRADIDNAIAVHNARIEAMTHRIEVVLWKHTVGILLNVLVIGTLLFWIFR
jgi:hypothetical protein